MEFIKLLRNDPDIAMVEIQEQMGISKSFTYDIKNALIKDGVIYSGENSQLPAPFTTRMAHPQQSTRRPSHAPVRHAWWDDGPDHWAVQGALLDRWDLRSWPEALPDEMAIVVRSNDSTDAIMYRYWSWTANRWARWTTERTARQLAPTVLSEGQLERLTLAVAWAMGTDAVIPPGVEVAPT
jgi:hypothetical protein